MRRSRHDGRRNDRQRNYDLVGEGEVGTESGASDYRRGASVAEGEIAGDYLEELLNLLDFDGDIDLDVEGDAAASIQRRR